MRKKVIRRIALAVALVIFLAILIYAYQLFVSISVSPTTIRLKNVEVTSDSVSFNYHNLNTAFWIKSYKYNVDNSGTLSLNFKGTMIKSLRLDENYIVIDNVEGVNRIQIVGEGEIKTVTVWTAEEGELWPGVTEYSN